MSAAAYGIFDITEGSTITLAEDAEVHFVDGKHNPNIADVAINADEADCHFGAGSKLIFGKESVNVWSDPIKDKEGYRVRYGLYKSGNQWVDNPETTNHHALEYYGYQSWYSTVNPSGSDWEVTTGRGSQSYEWQKDRWSTKYTYRDKIYYYTYNGTPDHRILLGKSTGETSESQVLT